jgi:hypothetical protein
MTATAIERLYQEFLDATAKAARMAGVEYQQHVLRLEREICNHLASQGGTVTVGKIQWALMEVLIGRDRLSYFKVLIVHEHRAEATAGYSFARRAGDIVDPVRPVSAQKPSLRRAAGRVAS